MPFDRPPFLWYQLYERSIVDLRGKILMNDMISANCKYSIMFNTFDGDIALAFYTRQIEHAYYSLEDFLKSIDDTGIKDFIDKIFYSYERLYKENFYRSQAQYFLYKGQNSIKKQGVLLQQ